MGLKGNFIVNTVKGDVVFTYAKIQNFGGNSDSINLSVFFTGNSDDELAPGAMKNFTFTPDMSSASSLLEQGYAYLKNLPVFSGAENV
ncbi:hypothetical protein [Klebsiella variicola]|uniref:hypothetical protein n=1 Tax=Klebsiella variicola TaxID=244366 RepID=UPI0007CCB3A3|nr:hypothetical protein [Klebsiella variicola]SBG82524.1 Uncharacterised protein [Klebsiella variicola]